MPLVVTHLSHYWRKFNQEVLQLVIMQKGKSFCNKV